MEQKARHQKKMRQKQARQHYSCTGEGGIEQKARHQKKWDKSKQGNGNNVIKI
jgi:hypothetical protein